MPEEVSREGEARRCLSGRKALALVIRTLVELQETKGVTPLRVYRHVAAEGETRVTPGRLQLAMERGVRDGILVQQRGRYNLNLDLPALNNARCGCGSGSSSGSKRRHKKSSSSKSCRKPSSSSRRRRSRSSSSSRRRRKGSSSSKSCRKRSSSSRRRRTRSSSSSRRRRSRSSSSSRRRRKGSSRRRKPLCGRSKTSLYKRLMRMLFPRKRGCKNKHKKKRMPYTWVRQHCRRNPRHSRNNRNRQRGRR